MERSDKTLLYAIVVTAIIEIVAFEIDYYLGRLSTPSFLRVIMSALGYTLRPTLVVMIIMLVDKSLRTKPNHMLLLIPLAICILAVSTAFFSHLCFWYNEKNCFQRGILGYVPHVVCIVYTFICLFVASKQVKQRDKLDVFVLIFAALCPVFAIALDILVEDAGLSRISIMLCTMIMYIQSYSIAINKMIDEIPGALAKLEVKNNTVKIVSFNELLCSIFEMNYITFKIATKDNPFAVLDKESRGMFESAVNFLRTHDEHSFRFKATLKGEEKYINASLKVSGRNENGFEIFVTMVNVTNEARIFEELNQRNNEISLMMNHLGKIICIYDVPTRTLSMSEEYAQLRGYSSHIVTVPDESIEKNLVNEEFREEYNNFYNRIFSGEHNGSSIVKFYGANGAERWEKSDFVIVASKDDKPLRAIFFIEDITETYQEKLLLNKYKSSLGSIIGNKKYCLLFDLTERKVLAYEGGLLPHNISFKDKTLEEIVDYFISQHAKDQDKAIIHELYNADNMIVSYNAGVMHRHIERVVNMCDGSEHWFRLNLNLDTTTDNKIMATLLCEDIDEEYRTYNVLIARANFDSLTGAFTREATMEKIEDCLQGDGANGTHALVMMDMDNLKALNDNLGHQFGDVALKNFANVVKEAVKDDDIVGRIGGDEFFVFIKNVTTSSLEITMQTLIHSLEHTYSNNDKSVTVTASAGISVYYGDRATKKSLNEMYSQADFALYKSKVNGKNTFTFAEE